MLRKKRLVEYLPVVPNRRMGYIFGDGKDIRIEGSIWDETEHYRLILVPIKCDIEVNQTPFDERFLPVTCADPENCVVMLHEYDSRHDVEKIHENAWLKAQQDARDARKISNRLRAILKEALVTAQSSLKSMQRKADDAAAAIEKLESDALKLAAAEKEAIATATKNLAEAVVVVKDETLSLTSPTKEVTYLDIDLSPIVPEGWTVQVEHLEGRLLGFFGIVVCHPDHLEEVAEIRKLTNADYRTAGTEQCQHTPSEECENDTGWVSYDYGRTKIGFRVEDVSILQCERETGHAGQHQTILNGSYFRWDDIKLTNIEYRSNIYSWDGAPTPFPVLEFGFKNICPYCGFVSAGDSSGNQPCLACSNWEYRLTLPENEIAIIDGKIHFIKAVDTEQKADVLKSDGSTWVEYHRPLRIPDWWRAQFPDNASYMKK